MRLCALSLAAVADRLLRDFSLGQCMHVGKHASIIPTKINGDDDVSAHVEDDDDDDDDDE